MMMTIIKLCVCVRRKKLEKETGNMEKEEIYFLKALK